MKATKESLERQVRSAEREIISLSIEIRHESDRKRRIEARLREKEERKAKLMYDIEDLTAGIEELERIEADVEKEVESDA